MVVVNLHRVLQGPLVSRVLGGQLLCWASFHKIESTEQIKEIHVWYSNRMTMMVQGQKSEVFLHDVVHR